MYIGHNKSEITLIADDTDVLMKGTVPNSNDITISAQPLLKHTF